MKEMIKGISFQEYYLTIIRLTVFLYFLGKEHKKKTTQDRLVLYDFFLKYPELTKFEENKLDFNTEYAYFHWKPNYTIYAAIIRDLEARKLIISATETKYYYITDLGTEFVNDMNNNYIEKVKNVSDYLNKNICMLSDKKISEEINNILLRKRGK